MHNLITRKAFLVGIAATIIGHTLCNIAHAAPTDTPVAQTLRTRAVNHEQQGEWLAAADLWRRLSALNPGAEDAFRHRVNALSQAGAHHLARQLADEKKHLFSNDERYQFAHKAAALTLGFGKVQRDNQSGAQRFATIDLAIDEQRAIAAEFGEGNPTRFDHLLALRERERNRDALVLFNRMKDDQVPLPLYVRIAAAEAWLTQKQPERARDLLLESLREAGPQSRMPDTELTLAYAYLETEQPDLAIALIDRIVANTPALSNRGLPGIERPNPEYITAAIQAALLRMYADRLDEAEQRLMSLRALAPFNTDVRLAWASLQNARDHRRLAREEFRLVQVDHPASIEAAAGLAEVQLALSDYRSAKTMLAALQESEPDHRAVRHLERQLALRAAPVLRSELTIGHGANAAGAESVLDTSWTSAPLSLFPEDDIRFMMHVSRSQGSLRSATAAGQDTQTVARNRVGSGLAYRSSGLTLDTELNHADGKASATGIVLGLASAISDSWQVNAAFDSNLNTLAAAAYQAGTTARQLRAGVTWSANEARKAGIELSGTDFSDGNLRVGSRLWWSQRWISGPVFKFDTTLSLATSRNRALPTPYFNPVRDQEVALAAKAEWLSWRRYERAFRQRVGVVAGRYSQSGFAGAAMADARYEHEWQVDDALSFSYGAGHGFHPYDGAREQRSYGYVNLNWIMQ
ncbi:poly-beta-1,6 N-acetyl-D-glucosamine export porin PgaA [Actimicrobium antarcticum]|uniref:Poly-beta-1,6 N-acetyl-D-glucosamine export porin PgaA n=1 Tax=Actimicrobium antarcticum TaxID=1051899 RepID=A0ABP7TA41_9BURK